MISPIILGFAFPWLFAHGLTDQKSDGARLALADLALRPFGVRASVHRRSPPKPSCRSPAPAPRPRMTEATSLPVSKTCFNVSLAARLLNTPSVDLAHNGDEVIRRYLDAAKTHFPRVEFLKQRPVEPIADLFRVRVNFGAGLKKCAMCWSATMIRASYSESP